VEIELFQAGGQIKTKRTSITTMGAKIQVFDIFQTPLSSHYPLPLNKKVTQLQWLRGLSVSQKERL
jgi:hypothetical protein